MKGLPRWWIPEAYRLRDSLTKDVKQWHAIARAQFKDSDVEEDGTDPWWGSALIRERQKLQVVVDNWDHDTTAACLFWG